VSAATETSSHVADLDLAADQAIAACGDARETVKALLVATCRTI
jgi:hypothetical protein